MKSKEARSDSVFGNSLSDFRINQLSIEHILSPVMLIVHRFRSQHANVVLTILKCGFKCIEGVGIITTVRRVWVMIYINYVANSNGSMNHISSIDCWSSSCSSSRCSRLLGFSPILFKPNKCSDNIIDYVDALGRYIQKSQTTRWEKPSLGLVKCGYGGMRTAFEEKLCAK